MFCQEQLLCAVPGQLQSESGRGAVELRSLGGSVANLHFDIDCHHHNGDDHLCNEHHSDLVHIDHHYNNNSHVNVLFFRCSAHRL